MLRLALVAGAIGAVLCPASAIAASWSPVEDGPTASAPSVPQLGVDGAGNLTAVYANDRDTASAAVATATRGATAGGWSPGASFATERPGGIALNVRASGAAAAGWWASSNFLHPAFSLITRPTSAGPWAQRPGLVPTPVNPDGGVMIQGLSIFAGPEGDPSLAWTASEFNSGGFGTGGALRVSTYEPSAWTTKDLSTATYGQAPRGVGIDDAGTLTAVQREGATLLARTRPVGGPWSAGVPIPSAPGGVLPLNVTALSENGAGDVVVFGYWIEAGVLRFAAVRRFGGIWGTPQELPFNRAADSAAVIAKDGTATIVWAEVIPSTDGGNGDYVSQTTFVKTVSAAAGQDFGAPTTLATRGPEPYAVSIEPPLRKLDLAAGPGGAAVATWVGSATSSTELSAAVRSRGGTWEAATRISTLSKAPYESPSDVAVSKSGQATVLWADAGKLSARTIALGTDVPPPTPDPTPTPSPTPTPTATPTPSPTATPTPTPSTSPSPAPVRSAKLRLRLSTLPKRTCPSTARVAYQGRTVRVPVTALSSRRCLVSTTLTMRAANPLGFPALVIVSGTGLVPQLTVLW